MARIPQVTRTMQTTKARIMCLGLEKKEPFETDVILPRTYKNDDAILKTAKPLLETETVKAVHVVSSEVVETLYGMSEQKFIEYADILPPRGTKED